MTSLQFPKTFDALKDLQTYFKCGSCGNLAENPCTLGGCEHIFCNTCCDLNLEKNECPICGFHVSVKDAQVNRQIFNLVRLCQRLEAVLTDQDCEEAFRVIGREGNDGSTTHCLPEPVVTKEVDDSSQKTRRTSSSLHDNSPNMTRIQKRVISPCGIDKSSPNPRLGGKKRHIPSNQRTMTQMLVPDNSDGEEIFQNDFCFNEEITPVKCRKTGRYKKPSKSDRKQVKGQVSVNQTTMSQFFDYISDSDVDSDDAKMEVDDKCQQTSASKAKQNNQASKKFNSHNLRTRTKISKLSTSMSSVKTSPCNSALKSPFERSPNIVSQKTPPSKTKSRRNSIGGVSRVQELREEHAEIAKSRKSLSPKRSSHDQSLKGNLNTFLTGSGKKSIDPLVKRNTKGETLLQVAAIKGEKARVEELLKAGATPNTRDNAGWTPLHEAVHYGHTDIARMLLAHGAMINVPGTDNDTPLHDALRQRQLACVKLLVSHGACTTSRNINGLTPEDFAETDELKAALHSNITNTTVSISQEVDVLEYQQPCLLPTGLSRDQKITLQKCATMIQGKVVDEFCPEVTHIVTTCNEEGMCPRTFKYLHGVLNGKWIVKFDWVKMCIEFGSKVCEEAFEIPGTSQNIESHAAEKGRTNRIHQLPKLFEGYMFYFYGKFQYPTPDKEDVAELVKSGGGQIITREPKPGHTLTEMENVPYHAPSCGPLSKCCIFVIHDNNGKFEPIRTETLCSVPVAWFLDCIGMFRIQSTLDF